MKERSFLTSSPLTSIVQYRAAARFKTINGWFYLLLVFFCFSWFNHPNLRLIFSVDKTHALFEIKKSL